MCTNTGALSKTTTTEALWNDNTVRTTAVYGGTGSHRLEYTNTARVLLSSSPGCIVWNAKAAVVPTPKGKERNIAELLKSGEMYVGGVNCGTYVGGER